MTKVCANCGVAPATPEPEPPPSATHPLPETVDPENCPNCGHKGSMQDVTEPVEKSEGEEEAE